ncbi:MAG: ATP-binding protein [Planctomycetes bacterium]|nr:ATP-binding protein [Planctomycetota bacterium]
MVDFLDNSEVLGILRGFNPWWGGRPGTSLEFKRLAYHACRRFLGDTSLRRAVLLSGPRRVGKTTILQQVATDMAREGTPPESILYVSLDHPLLKLLRLPEILALYHENVCPADRPAFLLLDEIQYLKGWDLELKQLTDHRPHWRILATGSASLTHHKGLAESGVGRWITVPMPTLSFYEFAKIRGEAVPDVPADLRVMDLFSMSPLQRLAIQAGLQDLLPLFKRYLLVGGFPETACHSGDIGLCQRLLREDVVERVLKRDMTVLFGVRSVADLEKLFIYICLHTGGIFSVQRCAGNLGVSVATVNNHLLALKSANLVYQLAPYAPAGKKVLKARHKVYLVDAALRNAVLLRGEEILSQAGEMGMIVETAVLRHMLAYYYRDTPQVRYWRHAESDKEVDIVVKSPSYLVAAEVKYHEKAPLTPRSGLAAFCRLEKPTCAFWITQRNEDFRARHLPGLDTPILEIPAHFFTYLLGQAERLLWQT